MIGETIAALRTGGLSPDDERNAVTQVAGAVDMSLRRVVRDSPAIAMPVRLRALAPDELSADEVLAELRQHDRISMELAASVHELFEARRRLRGGGATAPGDRALAFGVADRLERETAAPPIPTTAPDLSSQADQTILLPSEAEKTPWDSRRLLWAIGGIVLLVLVVAISYLSFGADRNGEMGEGLALFSSGEYADAAGHFYRYAEANPEDATPHVYLARIHRRMRRPDLAGPELERAIELAPEDAAVHTEVGLLLTDTKNYGAAVARFREAIRLDPEFSGAWIGLVRALRADGRFAAAEEVRARAPAEIRAMLARPATPVDTSAP